MLIPLAMTENRRITVSATVHAPAAKVWHCWITPEHIQQWNHASDDWHTPAATNDLQAGGRFCFRMATRDGSAAFDFEGTYERVLVQQQIDYTIADGRKVTVRFEPQGDATRVVETFEPEDVHPEELQQAGWQAILNNFKKHAEET